MDLVVTSHADVGSGILGAYLIPLSMFHTLIKMFLTPLSRSQVTLGNADRFLENDLEQMCLVRISSEGLKCFMFSVGLVHAKFSLNSDQS